MQTTDRMAPAGRSSRMRENAADLARLLAALALMIWLSAWDRPDAQVTAAAVAVDAAARHP